MGCPESGRPFFIGVMFIKVKSDYEKGSYTGFFRLVPRTGGQDVLYGE